MSKDDKKAEYTPTENVAATDVAAEETVAKRRLPLSKTAIIGLSAAGVAVILGAGFTGAAIANADHRGPDFSHSQQGGQFGQQGGRDGQRDGKHGQLGQQGQNGQQGQPGIQGQTGPTSPNGQFVDPDPNDNDGPGTGVAPQGVAPAAPQGNNGSSAPQVPGAAPQAQGFSAPNGFAHGS